MFSASAMNQKPKAYSGKVKDKPTNKQTKRQEYGTFIIEIILRFLILRLNLNF